VAEAHITATISPDLIFSVRSTLDLSLSLAVKGSVRRIGINSYTPHAFAAYVASVAAVEAFVNETFLGWMCRSSFKESALWDIPNDTLEKTDLLLKLVLVSQLLFGKKFERGKQPLQDFALLCRVRNDVVHFKMQFQEPKYIRSLCDRKIALVDEADEVGPWPHKLSSSEGIRWAHNTACAVVHQLVSFIPPNERDNLGHLAANFAHISEAEVEAFLSAAQQGAA
jgi:hypothetical protein